MTIDSLKKLQEQQLLIMDEIHKVCEENDITYYLIGGSAIGAVRHKGIIPWDADIDIAMPRKDYEQFIKLASDILPSDLAIYHNGNVKHYISGHAIVCRKESYIEMKDDKLNPHMQRFGIYVDVLPLDYVPSKRWQRNIQKHILNQIKKLRGLLLIRNKSTDTGLKKYVKSCVLIPIFKYAPLSTINKFQHWICRLGNKDVRATEICSKLSHYTYDRLSMEKEWFGKPILHPFSGRNYYIPSEVDLYLTKLFGDYMTYPSEDSRQGVLDIVRSASWIDDKGQRITI